MPGSAVALEEQHKICLFNKATSPLYTKINDGILALPALLGVRLTLECIAVQFVQAEAIQKILSKLENKDVNHE